MSTAKASKFSAVRYEIEATFAEDSNIAGNRLDIINEVDLSSLSWPMIEANQGMQFNHEFCTPVRGTKGGTIVLEGFLTGLGSTAAGALPAQSNAVEFLGACIGAVSDGPSGTTADGTGGVTTFGTTLATGFPDGQLFRLGEVGDTRGGGQWGVTGTHAASSMAGLTAFPAAPNAGDVLYTSRVIHPYEDPCAETVQSFRLIAATANGFYILRGCVPQSVEFFDLDAGQQPKWRVTLSVSFFRPLGGNTFPITPDPEKLAPCTVAAGSFFINDVGTVTRQTFAIRQFSISIGDSVNIINSVDGVDTHQIGSAAWRDPGEVTVTTVFDAEPQGTETWYDHFNLDETARPAQHALYSFATTDGRALAFYFPNLHIFGDAPTQTSVDGLNRVSATWRAGSNIAGATELERSSFRLGIG